MIPLSLTSKSKKPKNKAFPAHPNSILEPLPPSADTMLLSNFKLIASTALSIIACVTASPVPRDQGQILIGYRIANPVRMLCIFTDTDNSTDLILCCRNKVPGTIVPTLSLPIKMKTVCRLAQALTPLPNLGNGLPALVISSWLHTTPPE